LIASGASAAPRAKARRSIMRFLRFLLLGTLATAG